MGFPRRGCSTCKKRRIGCDSVRPICGRCQKADRDCLWDANEGIGWRFESENAFARGRPRRPRGAKQGASQAKSLDAPKSPQVSRALSLPLREQALNHWIRNFTLRPDDLPDFGHDFSVHVLPHLNASQTDSSLSLALSACSHAVFGRVRHVEKAFEEGETFYAQSIIKTQEQISKNLSSENLDRLLVTIMLMAIFENTMYGRKRRHIPSPRTTPSNEVGSRIWKTICHHKGASGLMNLGQKLDHQPDLALHRAIRRQVIKTCTLRGRHVPPWVEDGAQYGETGHMLVLDALMVRVVALRELSMPLFHAPDPDMMTWLHFLKEVAAAGQELDIELSAWAQSAPDDWQFSTAAPSAPDPRPRAAGDEDDAAAPAHSYATHAHAAVWNHYRAVRLIVNSIRRRAFALLLECPTQCSALVGVHTICLEHIAAMSQDLCDSVPFFFQQPLVTGTSGSTDRGSHPAGEIAPKMAELLAWPLTVAVSTDGVPERQRLRMKEVLRMCASASANAVLESVIDQGEFRF